MLKSLGQWTESTIKSRKIIPTGLTVATVKESGGSGDKADADTVQNLEHLGAT